MAIKSKNKMKKLERQKKKKIKKKVKLMSAMYHHYAMKKRQNLPSNYRMIISQNLVSMT